MMVTGKDYLGGSWRGDDADSCIGCTGPPAEGQRSDSMPCSEVVVTEPRRERSSGHSLLINYQI